jgi:serine phosphatase RsbU (regulator of sigma subunit)
MGGWSTAVLYRPAGSENWVGGDFYDAFPVRDGWMVVVGDVAGRGAPAAALTALTRYTIRAVAQLLEDPLDAVARLNRELYDRADGALCTVACAVLHDGEDGTGVAKILCAGHPQPYVIHDGHAERVGRFGPMVGALPEATWTPVTVGLAPGDSLLLYTDGVIDTVGEAERFGEARLQASLAGSDGALDAVRRLDEALLDFESGEQVDDTAAVALTRMGARDAHAGDHPLEPSARR